MTEDKKRTKTQIVLPEADAIELNEYLRSKEARIKMANELGCSLQSVRNWRDSMRFPRYCLPYLKNIRLIRNLQR